jgi:hypothetical protein
MLQSQESDMKTAGVEVGGFSCDTVEIVEIAGGGRIQL